MPRLRLLAIAFLLAAAAGAQTPASNAAAPMPGNVLASSPGNALPWEVGFNYNLLRTNVTPGACGCTWLNGVGESLGYRFASGWSAIGMIQVGVRDNVQSSGLGLDLMYGLGGGRYTFRRRNAGWRPFGQVLAGVAHQNGSSLSGGPGLPGPATAFAFDLGAGLELPLAGNRVLLRPFTFDYLRSGLPNGAGNRQNVYRYAAGIVFRFGGR